MLARREHSRRELRTKLEHAGCDEPEIRDVVERLRQQNYQDDARFAEMLLRARAAHGYGPARIRAELRSHGLDAADIDSLIVSADVDWKALALAQLLKKYGSAPPADYAERARRAQFLSRRGFDAATVSAATRAGAAD